MGRKLIIESEKLIDFIDRYITEVCNGNPLKIKIPELGDYIRSNGYPHLNDNIIRRNNEARKYIDSLKNCEEEIYLNIAVTYQTLDIEKFLMTNSSKAALTAALSERDKYYKKLALATIFFKDLSEQQMKKIENLELKNKEMQEKLEKLQTEQLEVIDRITNFKRILNELKTENKQLYDIITTYVYPEIANEVLKKDGLLKNTGNIIDSKVLEKNIITPKTKIQAKTSIIQGLFDMLD